jgi:hypothetical protein
MTYLPRDERLQFRDERRAFWYERERLFGKKHWNF